MTRLDSAWRAFYLATPCDCDRQKAATERCNLSGWIRCNRMLVAWREHQAARGFGIFDPPTGKDQP